jgi:hypothetical protein
MGLALLMALVAEGLHFLAPETGAWKLAGMGIALGAIALAGTEVFQQGLTALRRGRLNINALMAVAVTGAFLIGQWPEAAMVMALYSLAELIEARSVERASISASRPRCARPMASGPSSTRSAWPWAPPCASSPANVSRSTAASPAATARPTSRPSRAKASRWTRGRATRSSPARSISMARWSSK